MDPFIKITMSVFTTTVLFFKRGKQVHQKIKAYGIYAILNLLIKKKEYSYIINRYIALRFYHFTNI
jgi:hypothetical protein